MSLDFLAWILIGGVVLFVAVDHWRLSRQEQPKLVPPAFDERARQNPNAFEYVLNIMSKLEGPGEEILKRYVNTSETPPKNDVELLDLIDQHICWQGIADGRCGYIGNPHEAEVARLEELYEELQRLMGPVPNAKRERLHAAVVN